MAAILWGAPPSPDAPTWTTLASLANGAYALSSAIDNRTLLHQNALLDLALPSAVTCGTNAPSITIWVLSAPDASNYPSPPGGSPAATGVVPAGFIPALASASFTRSPSGIFSIPPFLFKLMIQNNLGVPFPSSGTFITNLYRLPETVV